MSNQTIFREESFCDKHGQISTRAIFVSGSSVQEVKEGLVHLSNNDEISKIDLSALGKTFHWDEVIDVILCLLQKENLEELIVLNKDVVVLSGKCQGYILDTIRDKYGDTLDIDGTKIRFRDIVHVKTLTQKIFGAVQANKCDPTIKLLNNLDKMDVVPSSLRFSIFKAYRFLRKKLRVQKKEQKIKTQVIPFYSNIREETLSSNSSDDEEPGGSNEIVTYVHSNSTKCYICGDRYTLPKIQDPANIQYPRLCFLCSTFNFSKRKQRTDLTGKTAVVTGGRLKIGSEIVLKLLRDGCQVIMTSRFPHDAARRFTEEDDHQDWIQNLTIYPLDLKDMSGIYKFVNYLNETLPYLDILINNAAQTIKRPKGFYQHLVSYEQIPTDSLDDAQKRLIISDNTLNYGHMLLPSDLGREGDLGSDIVTCKDLESKSYPHATKIEDAKPSTSGQTIERDSTQTPDTKRKIDLSDVNDGPEIKRAKLSPSPYKLTVSKRKITDPVESFPVGLRDAHGQQVDLRTTNSWRSVLEDVPVSEMLEVLMINTVAPFILNQELKPLMMKSPRDRKFIVNVSAMEGQFNRKSKTKFHPHTNMAKAALNMMTRTAALGYKEDGIYMTAVDTGWVTDERPFHMAQHEQMHKGFVLPLDCVDGAARVLDPIYSGLTNKDIPNYAVFLKNYKKYPW